MFTFSNFFWRKDGFTPGNGSCVRRKVSDYDNVKPANKVVMQNEYVHLIVLKLAGPYISLVDHSDAWELTALSNSDWILKR
jgi:hypothetical protein